MTEEETSEEGRAMRVRRALTEAPFSMRHLAADMGLSYGAVRAWAAGVRNPTSQSARDLAKALRTRGEHLQRLADDLERAANRDEAA